MISLGIETSGRDGSIALRANGALKEEVVLGATGRRHARTLVPEIGDLCKRHGLRPQDLDLVAVSIGPGSFTGLRVGVVCAKTMAYALKCAIVGVDSFLAVSACQSAADRIWVIEDALRGDVCAGEYHCDAGQWTCVTAPELRDFQEWRDALAGDFLITGPGVEKFASDLNGFRLGSGNVRKPQAQTIAALGEGALRAGTADDVWTLEPFYMRRSAAEEKADAAAQLDRQR